MNIYKLRQTIRLVPMVNDINQGNEYIFTEKIKSILPKTNYELLGEQLIVGKDNKIGKCDLWLANVPNNFLLSLELKVGESSNSSKRKLLNTQVHKYTEFMKFYFPEHIVYGIGAYKCIVKSNRKGTNILYTDYNIVMPMTNKHSEELALLKCKITNECLN